ncbi:MAG: hypothetical protein MH825_15585 [Cyanobacteria bacterium]|nr:hypothetical protein [Cyanobacteriota bacterium]
MASAMTEPPSTGERSRLYRWLGWAAIAAALSLMAQAREAAARQTPENLPIFWAGTGGFVALCLAIAAYCWFPATHGLTARILGLWGAAGAIFVIVDAIQDGQWLALLPALFFWLPGSLWLVWRGAAALGDRDP